MLKRNAKQGQLAAGLLIVSLGACASMAHAQSQQSPALDNVSIWLGAYYPNSNTNIGARSTQGLGSGNLNLENDLDFPKKKVVPRARLDFLIGEHQGFTFDYYQVDREHSRTLSESADFLGNNFDATAALKGRLRFDFGSAAYRWWFGSGSDVFGLGLGAAYYKIRADVDGSASLNGMSAAASATASEDAWAPNLQLGWRHAFNDQWRMYFNASGVRKSGGNLNGHIYDAALGTEWFPWKNIGFAAEYSYTRIKLNQDKRLYDLALDMKLNGPAAYVRFRF